MIYLSKVCNIIRKLIRHWYIVCPFARIGTGRPMEGACYYWYLNSRLSAIGVGRTHIARSIECSLSEAAHLEVRNFHQNRNHLWIRTRALDVMQLAVEAAPERGGAVITVLAERKDTRIIAVHVKSKVAGPKLSASAAALSVRQMCWLFNFAISSNRPRLFGDPSTNFFIGGFGPCV